MANKYYEKGRLRYFSRNQLIILDYPTVTAICIAVAVFIFGSLILLGIGQWTKLFNSIPSKPTKSTALEKKEGAPIALDFMDSPEEILHLVKTPEKAQIPEKAPENLDSKPEEKLAKIETKPSPATEPKPLPTPIIKKETPIVATEKKAPEIKPLPATSAGTTSVAPDNKSTLALNTTTETAETEEHIFYRKILESMIEEKLKLYTTSFPDKWKAVAGSYIVDVDINTTGQVEIKQITSSPNFFFNQVSDVILKSLKYPPIKTYGLKTYHQTFIFTYRPYGNQ